MITIKSDSDMKRLLDQLSYRGIVDLMIKDCLQYTKKYGATAMEWIPRIILGNGSTHEASAIPYGFLLHYQFCNLIMGYDMGIREIRLAESVDDFLDLYNEIQHDPTIRNKQKGE